MELDQIVASLDQRMKMLRDEISALEAARAALGGSPARASQQPARAANDRRPQRRRRHAAVTPEQLERLLAGAGEVTTTVLIEQTGASRPALLIALKELETSGKVARAGEKRGTRWSAVSGEAPRADQGTARGDWAGPTGDWEPSSLD
jgi:predicted Rossmann fold nucleotide-binding protein DprA/Smf involved in DNA uptake